MSGLRTLAEALGARRVPYLETTSEQVGWHDAALNSPDAIIDQIDAVLGIELVFPNPYPGEIGLQSKRGIVGFRSIQAIYQAWRIAEIAKRDPGFRVLEIGAGLGRTAYFANLFGIKDYSIVDIPLTNAAQGYFLGRTLGDQAVQLTGEEIIGDVRANIILATNLLKSDKHFDLIVNIDSWTEMSHETAMSYWDYAKTHTRQILSINHEHNPFTVRSLYETDPSVTATRFPYWMRRGYIEEFLAW